MLQFWNILYCRWKKTSDNRKFIVESHDIGSLRVTSPCVLSQHVGKKGDQLCMQMKRIYTAPIQHPMCGMIGREQD